MTHSYNQSQKTDKITLKETTKGNEFIDRKTILTSEKYDRLIKYTERIKNGEQVKIVLDYPKDLEEALSWDYKYWNDKPVVKLSENQTLVKIIDDQISTKYTEPIEMAKPYEWVVIDLLNDQQMDEVCNFLNKNYLTDPDNKFRLHYTKEYLRWSLGSNAELITCQANGIIGGVISANIGEYQVFSKTIKMADINYFCIHRKLREKGLASKFIDEITRRMINKGVITGSFTTQRYVPSPICRVEFYHRPLNYEKLHKTKFVNLDTNSSFEVSVESFKITYKHKHKVTKMKKSHYDSVYKMLCEYQDKYNFYRNYTMDEFIHYFANNDIVSSYVILNEQNEVLDFYSYYKLPYFVIEDKSFINAVYIQMYTTINVTQLTIFKSVALSAYEEKNDVLNVTDIMENSDILFDNFSKFLKGNGYLYYNFYNLTCPKLLPQQVCKITY